MPEKEASFQKPQYLYLQGKYQKAAKAAEKSGDLYRASFYWWILASLKPEDFQAKDRSKYLLKKSKQKAENHFQKGVSYLENNRSKQARTELLKALTYYPKHVKALDTLRKNLTEINLKNYQVKKGEDLDSIVLREYRNAEMAAVVANYNDLTEDQTLKPGTVIKLIAKDGPYPLEKENKKYSVVADYKAVDTSFTQDLLQRAESSYQLKNYSSAISLAKLVLKDSQGHAKAKDLLNKSIYQQAKSYAEQGNELEAMTLLGTMDENYRDVTFLKTSWRKKINETAETHYSQGVKSFLAEDLQSAADEWQTTLRLNPDHEKARKGLERVNKLLKRLNQLN